MSNSSSSFFARPKHHYTQGTTKEDNQANQATKLLLQEAADLDTSGDWKGAIESYRQSLQLLFQQVGHNHKSVAETYEKSANVMAKAGYKQGAEVARKKANVIYRSQFNSLSKQGKTKDAYLCFSKSKKLEALMETPLPPRPSPRIQPKPLFQSGSSLTSSRSLMGSSSRSITSIASTRSELRPETRELMTTLNGYLACRHKMGTKYQEVDSGSRLAALELKTDSGGIDNTTGNGNSLEYKEHYRQESINGGAVTTLGELYAAAGAAHLVFMEKVKLLVSKVCDDCKVDNENVKVSFSSLKNQDRALEKATDDYGRRNPGPGVSWLYDIVRGSVEFGSAAEIENFVRSLRVFILYRRRTGVSPVSVEDRRRPLSYL
jgi:hypothetical protein